MEDFQHNKFFAAMRQIFPDLENEAVSRSWTLLIPQSTSIQAAKFTTKSIIFSHILQPLNQYYQGFFLTLNGKSVEFNAEKKTLKACSEASDAGGAFPEERTVRVLFEEEFFIGDSSFKVYCINRPISGPGDVVYSTYDNKELFSSARSAKEWVMMIKHSRVNKFVVRNSLAFAAGINEEISSGKYLLFEQENQSKDGVDGDVGKAGTRHDAVENLIDAIDEECHTLVGQAIKRNINYACALKQPALFHMLSKSFHTLIHEEIYPNVFSAICNAEMEEENTLQIQLHGMRARGSSEENCKWDGLGLEESAGR